MIMKILLCLTCLFVSRIFVTHAHHPLVRELLRSGALQRALDLKNLKQNVNFTEIFSSKKKDVVVSDLGNQILKVAGNLPDNGTLIIQGESYLELFDPQDIKDPLLLLRKMTMGIKRKPVSVSLPVSEPYFIFSAPRTTDKARRTTDKVHSTTDKAPRTTDKAPRTTDKAPRTTDNITGTANLKDGVKSSALKEAVKLNRVKRHHPSVLSSVLSRLQSYALVPIKTPTGATRYLLMKNPKFIVYNTEKQQQQGRSQPRQTSAPQVPAPSPSRAGSKWMVPPMKSKRISIGVMPREAGGGGLTATYAGNVPRVVTSTNVQTVPSARKSNRASTRSTRPSTAKVIKATTPHPPPVTTLSPSPGTTLKLGGIVSKMAAIASGISKPQEIRDFQNAKADALQRLHAVITNKAERKDVIGFAKSLLKAMKLLNVVVVKHGERRDTAVFAQAMLSGLKRLDDIFKKGTKEQVVNYAKTMVDAIKLYDVEANPNAGGTAATTTTTESTTVTTEGTDTTTADVTEEPAQTTTEEVEMEATTANYYDYYYGAGTGAVVDYPSYDVYGAAQPPPPAQPQAPGVAGWSGGTTPEPALGPLDRVHTTDVPEEIEARPDKTPAEKRRDFLERNPHLRGKLPPLVPTKSPPPPRVQSEASRPDPAPVNRANRKTVSKPKNNKGKGKLKISGFRSTTTGRDLGRHSNPQNDLDRRNIPLYRRLNSELQRRAMLNTFRILFG